VLHCAPAPLCAGKTNRKAGTRIAG